MVTAAQAYWLNRKRRRARNEGVGAYHALAQRLLALKASTPYGGVMGSPPTVTVGAAGANSTVATSRTTSSPATLPDSANLTLASGNNVVNSFGNYTQRYVNTDTGATLFPSRGYCFRTFVPPGADQFDVCFRDLSSDAKYRVRINNEWVQADDFSPGPTSTGSNRYYTKFSPVSPGDLIEVYLAAGAQINGFNFGNGGSAAIQPIAAPEVDPINVIAFGDSYVYGSGPASCRGSWPHKFAEAFGIPNLVASGLLSTGLIANAGGASKTFINRVADLTRVNTPQLILIPGSLNDNSLGAVAVETATTAFLAAVAAAVPNALIAWFGIEHSPSNNPSSAYDAAVAAGFAAAGLGSRAKFFPTLDGSYQDTATGSLYAADNVHPSDAGVTRYTNAAVADVAAWLATL